MADRRWLYTNKVFFKAMLIVIALILIVAEVSYIHIIVLKLRRDQREIVDLNVGFYQQVLETEDIEDVSFLFDNIIKKINVPVILSTPDGVPLNYINIPEIASLEDTANFTAILAETMREMDAENPPIEIVVEDSFVVNMIHYGDSTLIKWVNWLPVVQILMVGAFILVGFMGFNNIRRSEQRYIWIGMAKETAHQLGTPISALYGWLELLKDVRNPERLKEISNEMLRDVSRLSTVAQRFSQIGSVTEFEDADLTKILSDTVLYFKRRIPRNVKSVTFVEAYTCSVVCRINSDLFEWTIENLIKNALDAVGAGEGTITVSLTCSGDMTYVDVTDTGKGMTKKEQRQVFKPGYSTKKRGWGLGLNLAKRIIEDHHNGELTIKQSRLNEGTTMRITLHCQRNDT